MLAHNDPIPEPAIFSAILTPHRSLPRSGFIALMLAVAAINFIGGVMFFVVGAWPVLGFLGLDVLLVYWAFKASYRSAAAYEQVMVTPSELKVRKVSHRGHVREWTLNPLWVRLDLQSLGEFGLQRLSLISRGRELPVASFLSPAERESFATALGNALNEAKRGSTRALPG